MTLDHDGLRASLKLELQLCRLQFRECLQHNSSQVFIIFIYCIRNSKNSTRLRMTRDKWVSGGVVCANWNWNWDWDWGTDNCLRGRRQFKAGRAGQTQRISPKDRSLPVTCLTDSRLTVHWLYLYTMSANWRTKEKLIELIGATDNKRRGRCAAAVGDGTEIFDIYSVQIVGRRRSTNNIEYI